MTVYKKAYLIIVSILCLFCILFINCIEDKNDKIRFQRKQIKTLKKMFRKVNSIISNGVN